MRLAMDPFRLLLISLAGWLNQQQQDVIDYLQEENRVLPEQLGGQRLRFNDDQRRRLAVRAKKLGRRMLHELTTMVTPATLVALAPQADRQEVRWQQATWPRPPAYDGRGLVFSGAYDHRESGLGYRRIQGALANLGHAVG